ncbi:MAG: LuxR family transcriptional regulator [Pseudomonadota bacterium]
MSERLNTILDRLQSLPNLSEFGGIIDAVRDVYDVDHVCYYARSLGLDARSRDDYFVGSLPQVDGQLRHGGRMVAAMSYSADWMARYIEANFTQSDPVLLEATQRFDPVDWSEINWNEGSTFFDEAADFGIGNQGYSVPVRGPGGQFAIFNINKTCPTDNWHTFLDENRTDMMLLAHFTHQQVLRINGLEHVNKSRPLSNRERDAVRLIADGLSRGQAAERLGISENTFRVYIDSARHKLGALNIPHAVALAAHRGLIPPN